MNSKALDVLCSRIARKLNTDPNMVIRACGAVDRNRTGLIQLAEMQVICNTYVVPTSKEQLELVLEPFTKQTAEGKKFVDYKNFIVNYTRRH